MLLPRAGGRGRSTQLVITVPRCPSLQLLCAGGPEGGHGRICEEEQARVEAPVKKTLDARGAAWSLSRPAVCASLLCTFSQCCLLLLSVICIELRQEVGPGTAVSQHPILHQHLYRPLKLSVPAGSPLSPLFPSSLSWQTGSHRRSLRGPIWHACSPLPSYCS